MASKLVILGNSTATLMVILALLQILPWTLIGLMILATLILPMLFSRNQPTTTRAQRIPARRTVTSQQTQTNMRPHRGPMSDKGVGHPYTAQLKPGHSRPRTVQDRSRSVASKTKITSTKSNPVRPETIPRVEAAPLPLSGTINTNLAMTESSVPPIKPETNLTVIAKGEYSKFDLELAEGNELTCTVDANGPVNVYVLDQENLTSLDSGEEFWQEAGEENRQNTTIHFTAPSTGKWFVVVENADFKEITATVNITK